MANSIDLTIGQNLWSEQDRAKFNKLDYFLAKMQVPMMKHWATWCKLLKKVPWTPGMGTTMRGVHREFSPVLRQTFYPNTMQSAPKKDRHETTENAQSAQLHWHRVESPLLDVIPDFQDFMRDHVGFGMENITQQTSLLNEQFMRTYILEASPKVWVAGAAGTQLVNAPHLNAHDTALVKQKTDDFWVAQCALVQSGLDLRNVNLLSTVMTTDMGADFFEGKQGQQVDEGLKGKYCLVTSGEVWDNWQFDPFLLSNRNLDLDIVTGKFKGSLFGKWTTLLEKFPLRIAADGTFPAPEILVNSDGSQNDGETIPNPAYVEAPYEIAFAVGAEAYKALSIGPAPGMFGKGEAGLSSFRKTSWNGEVRLTKDVLVNTPDENGASVLDTNKYGHKCQIISEVTFGVCPVRRRNIVPILFRRQRAGAEA